ncbi:formimidoylglutamase [Mangrovimonas sp. YM274]|uniref:formimidoylglutamase n=1 Tax=Mangrovimonas sp. YM274 TaxID=3070660 RepID=UPI0027DC2F67|nr:formimidoylglutamase [Mangrovimonas sp. YM274]WMI68276.1 formimidoylglutamase [Mangrovimonas sp. YM274]
MNFNFLTPISDAVLAHGELLSQQALGRKLRVHSRQHGFPDLEGVNMAIIGVLENRNDVNYMGEIVSFDAVRTSLYSLFPGNWYTTIADLGDILPGETVEDTYFALRTTIGMLLEKQIIPIVLGGSQDLTYANYRAYDNVAPMINIVNVDSNFDLGDASLPIKNNSFLGKIILEEPFNLFNYSAVGYQTYFNSQEEIDLMEKLYFEAYRLGEVCNSITLVEPVMRDAHIVSIDLKSVKASELSSNQKYSPNGLDGKEICAVSRYAGISNKVSSFGIYEYKPSSEDGVTAMLVAQMIWYFVEGVNCRIKDDDFKSDANYQKFNVLIEDDELIFYKSIKTGRWWIEIPFLPNVNNKLKKHTLLPCMYEDYIEATQGKIPERWYKAYKKNSF